MITERGIIDKISGRNAFVKIQRSSSCASCESKDSCEVHKGKPMEVEVDNRLKAREKDLVEISMPSGTFLILSLYVYFIPVVALIGGAYVGGTVLAPRLGLNATGCSVVLGFLTMGISFLLLRYFDKTPGANRKYRPRMTRIVTRFQS
jgi:sigma-E factor negative regulatory protein RseC